MSGHGRDTSDDAAMQAIMRAIRACYGNLDKPNFHKVSETLKSSLYHPLVGSLQSSGIEITETTDGNDDVAVHLVLNQSGNQVGLALSGVGPYAALLHQDRNERYS